MVFFAAFLGGSGAEMMRFKASSNLTPRSLKSMAFGMAEWWHKSGQFKSRKCLNQVLLLGVGFGLCRLVIHVRLIIRMLGTLRFVHQVFDGQ